MRAIFLCLSALTLFLLACERRAATEKAVPPAAVVPSDSSQLLLPPSPLPALPDTVDASRTYHGYHSGHDTTFYVGRQRYRLLLRAATDSTKPMVTVTEGIVGGAFADDTSTFAQTRRVRGYEGGQTITLLDSAGRRVFRRQLYKSDFYGVASRDIVTVSEPERPVFIGYHAASQTLAFTLDIGIPYSDVWQQCVLLLSLSGQVQRLATVYESNWEAPDCTPRLLPDGTTLTCQELLHAGGKRLSLLKPKSQLVAAFPLTDSTLLTVYRYGEYRTQLAATSSSSTGVSAEFNDPEWVVDKRMRTAPNTFVINLKGQVQQSFRYTGYGGEINYQVPRHYLSQTHSYYLLDEERGLYVLDKHNPTTLMEVNFRQMQRYRKPRRPAEIRFTVASTTAAFAFYLDPDQPTQLRYQLLKRRE